MANIPEKVNNWTRGTLVDLLDEGIDENIQLEFKSEINFETKKIPKTACAFANTKGGFLIFGVNNDRTENITTERRLVGLEDSDQLKSQINDQIRNVKPSIPIENIEFRESNIILPDSKVIVVLKISKSLMNPHQFENIFYKRVANGNAPMDVEEIEDEFIESQKSARMLRMLEQEEILLMDVLNSMKTCLEEDDIVETLNFVKHLDYSALTHFLYNYSVFYDDDIQELTYFLVRELHRLETNEKVARPIAPSDDDYNDTKNVFITNVENCIKYVKTINEKLELSYNERKGGFLTKIKEEIADRKKESTALKPSVKETTEESNLKQTTS